MSRFFFLSKTKLVTVGTDDMGAVLPLKHPEIVYFENIFKVESQGVGIGKVHAFLAGNFSSLGLDVRGRNNAVVCA